MNTKRLEALHAEARQASDEAWQAGDTFLSTYERGRADALRQVLESHRLDRLLA